MIQIDLPDLHEQELTFISDAVRRSDERGQVPATFLAGRVRLGGPQCVPITPEFAGDDADLRAFVTGESGQYAYHLVHLQITFAAEPEKPRLERAVVQLNLSAGGGPEPTAWSMAPLQAADASTVTTTVDFAPSLKFAVAGAEIEADLGSISRQRERTVEDPYLVAENLMEADPLWRFRRTSVTPLRGTHRLKLVVRAPWQVEATVKGRVTASTRDGIFRQGQADLPWPLTFRAAF